MLLSDFPQEIIEKIADLLPLEDIASCFLTCRSWKRIFQDFINSELFVNKWVLRKLVNRSQDCQPTYLKTRYLVRSLYLFYSVKITDEELYALQTTFPNIKYIHFEPGSTIPESFGATADWNIWSSLKELHISFDDSPMSDTESRLYKILMCLPRLRLLDILDTDIKLRKISFTLSHFEAIHSHLNHLEHLKMRSDLLDLSESDLEHMTKVSPVTKMGTLTIVARKADYRWLCYIARKYPNLQTLSFRTYNFLSNTTDHRDNTIALFNKVPLAFKYLKKLDFEYCDFSRKDYLFFFEMLSLHNIPLRHISIDVHTLLDDHNNFPDNLRDIPRHIAEFCLTEFSKTIESFNLNNSIPRSTSRHLLELTGSLYNLVKLKIKSSTTIEIDTLLYTAPRLKSLSFIYAHIKVKDELYDSKRFELQSFKIHDADITSDVLRFLSFHCRGLNLLRLERSSVYGNFTTPGCQFIDMMYSRLNTLRIYKTEFIIQENDKLPDNLNITVITRPFEDIPPKQDYDPKVLPVVIGGPSSKAQYSWFNRYYEYNMREVSKARGSRVEKFVSNFEENKRITMERALHTCKGKPYINWNKNCIFGYTKIKFGYIVNYEIGYDSYTE